MCCMATGRNAKTRWVTGTRQWFIIRTLTANRLKFNYPFLANDFPRKKNTFSLIPFGSCECRRVAEQRETVVGLQIRTRFEKPTEIGRRTAWFGDDHSDNRRSETHTQQPTRRTRKYTTILLSRVRSGYHYLHGSSSTVQDDK